MNIPYVFKKCTKCGRWLVASEINFYKHKNCKYGLQAQCKECYSAYRKENKERFSQYDKKYRKEHIEKIVKYSEKYRKENKDYYMQYNKKYNKSPQGQAANFNNNIKRRQREGQQGKGLTGQQWLEMMKFFDWHCAYSGEYIGGANGNKSVDHIVPLAKGGAHEIWNMIPMDKSLNCSKKDEDMEEWYPQQDFYDEDRLNKINEWCKYAYNKWGKEVNTKAI